MVEKPSKLQPAIVGGVVLGLLSSIPFISIGNACCCLWVLVGGAIAARTLIKRSPVLPVTTGDGAAVGAMAGVVGSIITLVVGIPIGLLMQDSSIAILEWLAGVVNNPEFSEQMRRSVEEMERQPFSQRLMASLITWFIGAFITVGFATIGGMLGVALFEKRKGQSPPPGPVYTPGYPPQGPPGAPPSPPPYGGSSPTPY